MFVYKPPNIFIILYYNFQWILHDWDDEDCVKILQNCKKVIPTRDQGGKIIIIDMVVGVTSDKHAYAVETQLLFE